MSNLNTDVIEQVKEIDRHFKDLFPGFSPLVNGTVWLHPGCIKIQYSVSLHAGDKAIRIESLFCRSYEDLMNWM